ncbi:MAG: aspartate-semialdehyde dehydrogenase [candidate division KSB1 bacterium]|nr:aspartate-semialdehyde dehydrogenase [candidate division KSB1 bacterium]MDZ7367125.1 aspartate-semialdehyde dehydrogenase [candidate division KSB1 bacterium]MDZ7405103.1 aspartate-semialdehyde dehydrogenase [candidate division KSB1 bacterium]
MREKIKVGVLGATGAVGQKFVQLLATHPWFELAAVAASERSVGKTYGEAARWFQNTPLPERIRHLIVKPCRPGLDCQIVFSGLDASVAGEVETEFADAGYAVFSNARNHRLDDDVPLVIPELNADHLQLIAWQQKKRGGSGFMVTNSNCSTMFLAMALGPLHQAFGVEKVFVATMQAISGAGYPGVAALDILGNVIPFINGEEEKIEIETRKILGALAGTRVQLADFVISAQTNRVPVEDGHTECVAVKFKKPASVEAIKERLQNFRGLPQELNLPSAPPQPIIVMEEPDRPQPRRDAMAANGMATLVGRIRPCPLLDFRFVILGHNTIRGAAGASILNAELLVAQGKI